MSDKYKVLFPNGSIKKRFEKALDRVNPEKRKRDIRDEALNLSDNPRPQDTSDFGYLKGGGSSVSDRTAQYRLRIGEYRILYDVDDDDDKKIVWLLALRKRDENTYS